MATGTVSLGVNCEANKRRHRKISPAIAEEFAADRILLLEAVQQAASRFGVPLVKFEWFAAFITNKAP